MRTPEQEATKLARSIGVPEIQIARGSLIPENVANKTEADQRHSVRSRETKTVRRKRVLERLHEQGTISTPEFRALKHYRHHADTADRSPLKDSLRIDRYGGSGNGPTVEMLNAIRVRDDCERAAGSLRNILVAVIVNDMSLSQWAIEKAGALEDCEDRNGHRVCRLKPRQKALAMAKQDIKMAAQRVQAELDA